MNLYLPTSVLSVPATEETHPGGGRICTLRIPGYQDHMGKAVCHPAACWNQYGRISAPDIGGIGVKMGIIQTAHVCGKLGRVEQGGEVDFKTGVNIVVQMGPDRAAECGAAYNLPGQCPPGPGPVPGLVFCSGVKILESPLEMGRQGSGAHAPAPDIVIKGDHNRQAFHELYRSAFCRGSSVFRDLSIETGDCGMGRP